MSVEQATIWKGENCNQRKLLLYYKQFIIQYTVYCHFVTF